MFNKINVSDELTFYENKDLNCYVGDNETEVNVGVMVEVLDLVGATGEGDENYPFIVSMGLMASSPHESFNELQEGDETSQASLLYDCNSYMGSIPVDHVLVNAVNGGLDEILPMFSVGEAKLMTIKSNFGTVAAQQGPGTEFKYLMFASEDAAQKFVDFVMKERASVLTMMIGFILDRPINMMGDSGWSQIETMVNGSRYNKSKGA